MATFKQSSGDCAMSDSMARDRDLRMPPVGGNASQFPLRDGALTVRELVHLYLSSYSGRDSSRMQRLEWWVDRIGGLSLSDLSDDHVHSALDGLAKQPARYYMGKDADGRSIFKSKGRPLSPASVNRYAAALAAVVTWAIKRRITPKGYAHPCKTVDRPREHNEKTRFLTEEERHRLLQACRESRWPKLYLLVLLALTTGARKSEILRLRWQDMNLELQVAYCARTKNGDPRGLPLLPGVIQELNAHRANAKPSDLVFPSRKSPGKPYSYEGRWRAALRTARIREFRFHDLRHTCASMLAQNGATLLEIADVLGHRQLQVTKRYSHLTTQHKSALLHRVLGDIA
ncbi:site-specific integrase [Ramlibacter ginsenosidimutans]|uniref:Site-specific integrase n=1 Tax=Ramlibacter ginsenosidimutans TaxID=502333 RepID=A0A934TSX2_9BURK|nr:site-specific integrase [Ramlibacter ginsenosidimutans]MBK6006834.1 site-specific integrase [Ramlibacter ginsenosidimutans]